MALFRIQIVEEMMDLHGLPWVLGKTVVRDEMRVVQLVEAACITRMGGDDARNGFQDRAETLFLQEHRHDAEVVPPREVPEELVDGLMVKRLPAPNLAFEDQYLPMVDAEIDVRFAPVAEGFAGRPSLENGVQVYE